MMCLVAYPSVQRIPSQILVTLTKIGLHLVGCQNLALTASHLAMLVRFILVAKTIYRH